MKSIKPSWSIPLALLIAAVVSQSGCHKKTQIDAEAFNGGETVSAALEGSRKKLLGSLRSLSKDSDAANLCLVSTCDADPAVCHVVENLGPDLKSQVVALLTTNSFLEEMIDRAIEVELQLTNEELSVSGKVVDAMTQLGAQGGIKINYARAKDMSPSRQMMLLGHELGHKSKVPNASPTRFHTDETLLDGVGACLALYGGKRATFMAATATETIASEGNNEASHPHLLSHQGKLFAIWRELVGGTFRIRVAMRTVTDSVVSWNKSENPGSVGLNANPLERAARPHLISLNDKLYAAWEEDKAGIPNIRVAVYAGGQWQFVDGGSLNLVQTLEGGTSRPIIFQGKLYVFWYERNASLGQQIRGAVYGGNDQMPQWIRIDGGDANKGINWVSNHRAVTPSPIVHQGKLYLSFSEKDGLVMSIRVAVYNGNDSLPGWGFVDGNAARAIITPTALNARVPQLISSGGKLFLIYEEETSASRVIRVASYNDQDANPAWSFIDGGEGLNYDPDQKAYEPSVIDHGGRFYILWEEDYGVSRQARIASFTQGSDGTFVRTFLTGDGAFGLNHDTNLFARNVSLFQFAGALGAAWRETSGGSAGVLRLRMSDSNQF